MQTLTLKVITSGKSKTGSAQFGRRYPVEINARHIKCTALKCTALHYTSWSIQFGTLQLCFIDFLLPYTHFCNVVLLAPQQILLYSDVAIILNTFRCWPLLPRFTSVLPLLLFLQCFCKTNPRSAGLASASKQIIPRSSISFLYIPLTLSCVYFGCKPLCIHCASVIAVSYLPSAFWSLHLGSLI